MKSVKTVRPTPQCAITVSFTKAGGPTPYMAIGAATMSNKAVTHNHVHQNERPVEKLWLQFKESIFQLVVIHLTVFMANAGLCVTLANG